MTFKPAHKDTDTPPGQIVNSVSVPETHRSKTIGGIVDRVMRSEAPPIKKKLTFDEWLKTTSITPEDTLMYNWGIVCWKAAQENV
jgi:hypothetical protein